MLKSPRARADVQHVMEPKPTSNPTQAQQLNLPSTPGTDAIAATASELMELIRSGNGMGVNDLVRRTLGDRHAA